MDFKQILSFQKVARLKSFSKASKELYLSQPTITSHIIDLEKELDMKLLSRSKTKVELTETGEMLLKYVNQIIALHDEAVGAIKSVKKGNIGSLKLALSDVDCYWLFPLLKKFQLFHANVDIGLSVIGTASKIIDTVLNRKAHFAFIRHESPLYVDPLLNSKTIDEYEAIIVFSAKHKFAQISEVTLKDISQETLIGYGKKSRFWNQVERVFYNAGLVPKVSLELSDHHTVKQLLQTSWGMAFLPYICVKEEIEQGLLKTVPIKDCPPIKRYLVMISRRDLPMTDLSRSFLEMINRADICYGSSKALREVKYMAMQTECAIPQQILQ